MHAAEHDVVAGDTGVAAADDEELDDLIFELLAKALLKERARAQER